MRGYGADAKIDGSVLSQSAHSDTNYGFLQGGVAGGIADIASGNLTASLFAHYGASNSDTYSGGMGRTGALDFSGYGGGASVTWLGHNGGYVDAVAIVSGYSIDSESVRGPVGSTNAMSFGGSIEVGKRFEVAGGMFIIPEAQLVYQTFQIDDFTNTGGMTVAYEDPDSLLLRTGVSLGMVKDSGLEFRGELNLLTELLNDAGTILNGIPVVFETDNLAGEIGVGATYMAPGSRFKLWADADYTFPFGDGLQEISGIAGVKIAW